MIKAYGRGRTSRARPMSTVPGVPEEGLHIMEKLDWKWIAIGTVTMIVLNIVAAMLLILALGPQIRGVTSVEEINLSSGQIWLVLLANALSFLIGGFI